MAIVALEMPKWGMTMEEGVVSEWMASPGERVEAGQAVVTVESSKITGEVAAPASGVLARTVAAGGETVAVGELLGVIADSDTPEAEVDAFVAGTSPAKSSGSTESAPATGTRPAATPARPQAATPPDRPTSPIPEGDVRIPQQLQGDNAEDVPATPHARALAEKHHIALTGIDPSGSQGRVTVADLQRAVTAAGGHLPFGNDLPRKGRVETRRDDSEILATPHARALAQEHGVNLFDARPTGTHGRVTVADVKAVLAQRGVPVPDSPTVQDTAVPAPVGGPLGTEEPLSPLRRVIADRLQGSYQDAPHFRVSVQAQIDDLLALRRQINDSRLDVKVSVNDLVIAATARALMRVPEVNAQFDPERQVVTRFPHADISVAVSTAEGLITPIVTHAESRTITQISSTMDDLATRAKAGTLKPDEFQGGTFTISNLGMFGVSGFDAIINPPQVAILAVGAGSSQFVPGPEGEPRAVTLLPLTLSSDHRVVDGALAARFLAELRTLLQSPALIFA